MARARRYRGLVGRGFVERDAAGRGREGKGGEKESVHPAFRYLIAEEGLDRQSFTRR